MSRRIALLVPLLLAACAQPGNPPGPDLTTNWVGRSEADLVSTLGVPDRVHEVGGRRFLAYEARTVTGGPVVTPSLGFGLGRFSGGWGSGTAIGTGLGLSFGGGGAPVVCGASYEVQNGQVVGQTRQGPGCA